MILFEVTWETVTVRQQHNWQSIQLTDNNTIDSQYTWETPTHWQSIQLTDNNTIESQYNRQTTTQLRVNTTDIQQHNWESIQLTYNNTMESQYNWQTPTQLTVNTTDRQQHNWQITFILIAMILTAFKCFQLVLKTWICAIIYTYECMHLLILAAPVTCVW